MARADPTKWLLDSLHWLGTDYYKGLLHALVLSAILFTLFAWKIREVRGLVWGRGWSLCTAPYAITVCYNLHATLGSTRMRRLGSCAVGVTRPGSLLCSLLAACPLVPSPRSGLSDMTLTLLHPSPCCSLTLTTPPCVCCTRIDLPTPMSVQRIVYLEIKAGEKRAPGEDFLPELLDFEVALVSGAELATVRRRLGESILPAFNRCSEGTAERTRLGGEVAKVRSRQTQVALLLQEQLQKVNSLVQPIHEELKRTANDLVAAKDAGEFAVGEVIAKKADGAAKKGKGKGKGKEGAVEAAGGGGGSGGGAKSKGGAAKRRSKKAT